MTELRSLPLHYRFDLGQGVFSYVGSVSLSLLGFSPAELQNNTIFNTLVIDQDRAVLQSKILLCDQSSELHRIRYRVKTKDGTIKRIVDLFMRVIDEKGYTVAIEGEMMEEANDLKSDTSDELNAYREAIDINIIASITDSQGTILYANDKFCQISQYTREELIGKNHRIVNSGHHTREFFAGMWKTIASGQPWHGEVLNKAKDGSLYWVDSVIIPIFNDDRKITRYLSLRQVITDRKNAEVRNANYIHALEEMAFMVSHGFRGPVCSIQGLVNLMSNYQQQTKHDHAHILKHLVSTCDNLVHLADELSVLISQCENVMYKNEKDNAVPWYWKRESGATNSTLLEQD